MLNDKFFEVLKHEGVVSVVTWGNGEPNITNTWNSYLEIEYLFLPQDLVVPKKI